MYLRWELDLRMMFSKNVFWGATRPRRPPGIMGAPLLPRSRLLAMFARVCRFGHIGGQKIRNWRTRTRRRLSRQRRWPRYRRLSDELLYYYSRSRTKTMISQYYLLPRKLRIDNTRRREQFERRIITIGVMTRGERRDDVWFLSYTIAVAVAAIMAFLVCPVWARGTGVRG